MPRAPTSPKVVVPSPEEGPPPLARVGVIALVGFAIGIVWPWLAGVRFVPSAPGRNDETAALAAPAPSEAPEAPTPPAAPQPTITRTDAQTVNVGEALVVSCRDDQGNKQRACDAVDFTSVAHDKLLALAACPAAQGASKVLSIGFDVDFTQRTVRDVDKGKSTTFDRETTRALLACAKKEFETVDLSGIAHENARYQIYYLVEFVPPGSVVKGAPDDDDDDGAEPVVEASGLATVRWDVALVRDAPDTGKVSTRLRYGTRVEVAARKGKWYLIKYDGKGNQGWVHENAIGL
jgi:hypothetical protein